MLGESGIMTTAMETDSEGFFEVEEELVKYDSPEIIYK